MKAAVLISHDVETGSCVIGVPNEYGGQTELALDPPFSAPQFLPDVGEEVLLTMDGPVPRILPQQLGVDSVGLAEVRFGTVTALLLQGDQIIAGDPDGNHVVIDVAGVRLVKDGVDVTIDLQTETGAGLFTGELRTTGANGYSLRVWPGDDFGATIDFLNSTGVQSDGARIFSEGDVLGGQDLHLTTSTSDFPVALVSLGGINSADGVAIQANDGSGVGQVRVTSAGMHITTAATGPTKRTLPAAATDLATALTLLNDIRDYLIDTGQTL